MAWEDTATVGAENMPDAGGAGAPPAPPPAGIPSVASPAPSPAPAAGTPSPGGNPIVDRLTAMMQPPQESGFKQAMRKAVPLIAAAFAATQGGGSFGSFVHGYQEAEMNKQKQKDLEAQRQERLTIAIWNAQKEQVAQNRIDAQAKNEQWKERHTAMKDAWTSLSTGKIADTLNSILDTQGSEGLDQYLKSTAAPGVPGATLGDLVSQYGVRDPDGHFIGGKVKADREAKVGTMEYWTQLALDHAKEQNGGKDLTTEQQMKVQETALHSWHEAMSIKDPALAQIELATKRMIYSIDSLRLSQLRQEQGLDIIEIKPGTPQYKVAQDLASGRLAFSQFRGLYSFSRNAAMRNAIYTKATELNPNFSPALFERDYRFATNPQTQRQFAAIDNVMHGVDQMVEASEAAARSGVKALNQKFVIPGGVQLGDHTYSDLATAATAFADELSGALGYGTTTDMTRQMGLNMVDPSLSPEAFISQLRRINVPFLIRRRDALLRQMGTYGTGPFAPAGSNYNPNDPAGVLRGAGQPSIGALPPASSKEALLPVQ